MEDELGDGSEELADSENYEDSLYPIYLNYSSLDFEEGYSSITFTIYSTSEDWTARVEYSDGSTGLSSYQEEEVVEDSIDDDTTSDDIIIDSTTSDSGSSESEDFFYEDEDDYTLAEDALNYDPTALTEVDWLRINTNNGTLGETMITATVYENSRETERSASIIITDASGYEHVIPVNQEAGYGDVFELIYVSGTDFDEGLKSYTIDVSASKSNISLKINTNTTFWATIDDEDDWVSTTAEDSASKSAPSSSYTTITCEANEENEDRTATVTFSARYRTDIEPIIITINQSHEDIIEFSADQATSQRIGDEGGDFTVEFSANMTLEIESMPDWITQVTSRAITERSYNFTAEPFTATDSYGRSGAIVFKNTDTGFTFEYGVSQGNAVSYYTGSEPFDDFSVYLQLLFGTTTLNAMEGIVISGELSETELNVLGDLAKNQSLVDIDLSGVTVVGDMDLKYYLVEDYIVSGNAIPTELFRDASYMTRLVLPKNIKYIADYAFYGCTRLQLDFGELLPDLEYIGNYAFSGCAAATGDLTLPESLTFLGASAFSSCSSMTGSVSIPTSITAIEKSTFSGCSRLSGTLVIPSHVTSIGTYSFSGCSNLSGTLVIPATLSTVPTYAFYNCTSISSVVLEEGVTTIDAAAFYGCSGITTSLVLPSTIKTLGNWAFRDCMITGCLTIPGSLGEWSNTQVFRGTKITSLVLEEGLTTIGVGAFAECADLDGTLTLPSTMLSIDGEYLNAYQGIGAFSECTSLDAIEFNTKLSSIADYAFYGCSALTSLTFPTRLESIGRYSFDRCYDLASVTFNENLTSISHYAFQYCTSLSGNLQIPASVTTLGTDTFRGCSSLDSLEVFWADATALDAVSVSSTSFRLLPDTFSDGVSAKRVYIPSGSMDAYSANSKWSDYNLEERTE